MSTHPSRPSRRARAVLALAALGLLAALPTPALAAPGTGSVELTLKPGGAESLLGQDVQVRPSAQAGRSGSAKRAQTGGTKRIALPVADLTIGASSSVTTQGGLVLSLGNRRATARLLTVKVGPEGVSVLGKLGKKQLVLFRAQGELQLASSTLKLEDGQLSLTARGAKALRERLGLEQLAAGPLGSIAIDASLVATPKLQTPVTPAPPAPPESKKPIDETLEPPFDPFAADCKVSAGDTGGFGEEPTDPGPLAAEPTLSNPLALTAGGADWGFHAPFRNYVLGSQGPGTAGSISALDGAVDNGDGSLGFAGTGEYQRHRTAADDQLVLDGKGTMLFCKSAHHFYAALQDPTVVLDGANSRLVVDAGLNSAGVWGGFRRADFASLDLTGLRPAYSADGKTATWSNVPATLTEDGAKVSGLYPAGTEIDPITVTAAIDSVPDLYSDTCAIGGTTVTPGPELPEAPAALPTLANGVATDDGAVVWGIHTPFRNQILSNLPPGAMGSLQTFEGATYTDPAFTYPAESGRYEEGNPGDTTDDKLVLNAGGIALLCKSAHGYRYALGNPTVVIDGANSRLVLDMDLRINGLIDPSVRSDFATLDMTGIVPTVDSGTITWTNIPVKLTQNGAEAINSRYPADTVLDPITVSASLP